MAKADGYIGTDGAGRLIPPPLVCPRCEGPTRRTGNRHHREVCCAATALADNARPDHPLRACTWRATVFYVPSWLEGREYTGVVAQCIGWPRAEGSCTNGVIDGGAEPRCPACSQARAEHVARVEAEYAKSRQEVLRG